MFHYCERMAQKESSKKVKVLKLGQRVEGYFR